VQIHLFCEIRGKCHQTCDSTDGLFSAVLMSTMWHIILPVGDRDYRAALPPGCRLAGLQEPVHPARRIRVMPARPRVHPRPTGKLRRGPHRIRVPPYCLAGRKSQASGTLAAASRAARSSSSRAEVRTRKGRKEPAGIGPGPTQGVGYPPGAGRTGGGASQGPSRRAKPAPYQPRHSSTQHTGASTCVCACPMPRRSLPALLLNQ
jgi:hypothetical protein